jgi:thiosulfate/3-mercaptopyruvate sulfurtransferase
MTNPLIGLAMTALWLAGTVSLAADPTYPQAELLVEPAELAAAGDNSTWVVLDARAEAAYRQGHVPGARWVDHAQWSKTFAAGQDAADWSQRIGALGLSQDSRVVVYDASQFKDAARIWWILRYWGVNDVRLLNGGWTGWQAGAFPIEQAELAYQPTEFNAVAAAKRLATQGSLLNSLAPGSLQIVDARSEGEYCGTSALKNARAGAIPGAKHLEWADLVDAQTHRFKPAAELRQLFAAAGIDPQRPTATYCQSGGRASVMAFALELMGGKQVQNYYRSWAEWGNSPNTPVERPEPPQPER